MEKFRKCLNIVDTIIEEGGYGTIRVYLASVMDYNNDAYEQVLESSVHGRKVKDMLQEKGLSIS